MRILFLITIVVLTVACGTEEQSSGEPPLRPVRVFEVADGDGSRSRTFAGISQSTQESRLSFKVTGTIVELPVQVGAALTAGQRVARLDPSSFELEVEQASARLVQAEASLRNSDANYSRVRDLYENTNASRTELDTARANAESMRAEVRAAEKALEIARLNASYTELKAASDCVVATVSVELNENVAAGAEVAKVNCGAGIEVRADIPEGLIGQVGVDMSAQVTFSAVPDKIFAARVTEVGVGGGTTAATFPVVAALEAPDARVRPSMAARIEFNFLAQTGTHLVPTSAVVKGQDGTHVFLARDNADGSAMVVQQAVEIGELREIGIEVRSGLEPGDLVITAGTSFVRDGQTVLLPE